MKRLKVFFLFLLFTCLFIQASTAQVNASFTVDRYNICSGTSIQLNNTSIAANKFDWKIDGLHYSFSRDTSAVLHEDCYSLHKITLVAEDSITGFLDSASIIVEVFDTCFFHWTGTFLNCPGDTISLAITPEEISTLFSIQPSVNVLAGCFTCPSIQFTLLQTGTTVDRESTYIGGCSEITSYEYFCGSTSIKDIHENKLHFSPNPVSDRLIITNEDKFILELIIFDLRGKTILTKKINEGTTAIDLSFLSGGIYFIRSVNKDGGSFLEKFIKLRST